MIVTNRGRTPSSIRPPKGINVNNTNIPGFAVGPQCPEHFAKYLAPRKNSPGAMSLAHRLTTTPTGSEVARHG